VADYSRIRDAIEAVIPGFEDYNERVRLPGGFRLPNAAGERQWRTATKRANFIVARGVEEDPKATGDNEVIRLATIRSHDQYNTTIYGWDDRYRGITGRRDVIFLNAEDLAAQGLEHSQLVDVEAVQEVVGLPDTGRRVLRGLTAVAFDIARGAAAAYYPEANALIALENYDPRSGTPSYKSVPVVIRASAAGQTPHSQQKPPFPAPSA
jgi:anaerobic selenocysteine-containing dehydrogenase